MNKYSQRMISDDYIKTTNKVSNAKIPNKIKMDREKLNEGSNPSTSKKNLKEYFTLLPNTRTKREYISHKKILSASATLNNTRGYLETCFSKSRSRLGLRPLCLESRSRR